MKKITKKSRLNYKLIFEKIKKDDVKTDLPKVIWFAVRFCIYGCFGMVNELIFTDLLRFFKHIPFFNLMFNDFTKMIFPYGVPTAEQQFNWPSLAMFSMTSFWLLPVYGIGFMLIESAYKYFKKKTSFLNLYHIKNKIKVRQPAYMILAKSAVRLSVYTAIIFSVELLMGWIYKFILGFFVWQYDNPLRSTTWSIIPSWLCVTFFAEKIVQKFSESDIDEAFSSNDTERIKSILKEKNIKIKM